MPRALHLTPALLAAHTGEQVLCLAASALGRSWELYEERPGVEYNARLDATAYGLAAPFPGSALSASPPGPPPVISVGIVGLIDERANAPGPCEEWVDGNDAIGERLCAAFAEGDVLLTIHSPGGNPAGAPEAMRRAREAKAANGRRCIVHTEGMCGSLALWWAYAIGDEFYATADSTIGSIGARGAHKSVAGALTEAGIVVTFSAWPGEGKLAGVAELPLGKIGKARNDRDVALIGERFAADLIASPIGKRLGLTLATIAGPSARGPRGLDSDALDGVSAIGVLIDGLATVEEVAGEMLTAAGKSLGATEAVMTTRAEGGETPKDKPDDVSPESARTATKPETKCAYCGVENPPAHKFCAQCGKSMAAQPMKDPDEKDPDSARGAALAHRAAVARPSPVLASVPALRAALATSTAIVDRACAMVGARTHGELLGALEATCKDASNGVRYRTERNAARRSADAKERLDGLLLLAQRDPVGHPRGELIVDVIEQVNGKPVVTGIKPAALWGDGPEGRTMENFRGYLRTTLARIGTAEASPYGTPPPAQPDAARADAQPMAAEIERAKRDPVVLLAAQSSTVPLDELAKNHVLMQRAARGAAQVPA